MVLMVILHADSYRRSNVVTYLLDLSSWIHGATLKEANNSIILSDYSDGYTACIVIHEEYGDNLQAGFIKLDPWSSIGGRTE